MAAITGMTIAIVQMEAMLKFYTAVFDLHFTPSQMMGHTLYHGKWGALSLQFCPAELAGNSATQNKHQLDVLVEDIHSCIQKVTENQGSCMAEISEDDKAYRVGIYDPDGNSLVLQQLK
ncbi:VOC family protein [Spongiimicrobium salis]|uniref:VOC family protein n=1 Tax=Spongiimicrobium salis TaxID=1667022 RepID=UPI00374DCEEC